MTNYEYLKSKNISIKSVADYFESTNPCTSFWNWLELEHKDKSVVLAKYRVGDVVILNGDDSNASVIINIDYDSCIYMLCPAVDIIGKDIHNIHLSCDQVSSISFDDFKDAVYENRVIGHLDEFDEKMNGLTPGIGKKDMKKRAVMKFMKKDLQINGDVVDALDYHSIKDIRKHVDKSHIARIFIFLYEYVRSHAENSESTVDLSVVGDNIWSHILSVSCISSKTLHEVLDASEAFHTDCLKIYWKIENYR